MNVHAFEFPSEKGKGVSIIVTVLTYKVNRKENKFSINSDFEQIKYAR